MNIANEIRADNIPLRPPSHLLIALGFTCVSGAVFYTAAALVDAKSFLKRILQASKMQSFFTDMTNFFKKDESKAKLWQNEMFIQTIQHIKHNAMNCVFTILVLNVIVTAMWKFKPIEPLMWRYFTNSFASKSLCSPMLLSIFSHKSILHLVLNMFVLWQFAPAASANFLGVSQFCAFYLTSGLVSSFTSLVHKSAVGCPVRALGASGAILGVMIYTCAKIPDTRLQIIFLPFFDFSAENAIYGIIFFDLAGLLLGYRLFDHAAHLGGALFGLFYAKYGENWYKTELVPTIMKACIEEKDSPFEIDSSGKIIKVKKRD